MKCCLFVLFCLASVYLPAQRSKFTFKLGQEYELPRKTEDLAFFGNEKDGIVNLSLKREELIMVRFDPITLNKTIEKTINIPDASRNFNSETLAQFDNGNYFWLHSDWDKSNEREMLFYDKIDVQSGRISEANHKILEASKIAGSGAVSGMSVFNFKVTGKYNYDYDAHRTKLLVSYRLFPEFRNDKKNIDVLGLQVFDENMTRLWGGEFRMPYTEAVMDNEDFSVDSKGNAYLLAKVYESDKRKERDKSTGKAGYHFEILKFTRESKKIAITPVSIDDNFIRESSLIENPSGEMILACTYSKNHKGTGTDGIFLATLGLDGKIVKYKNGYYEFPKEELEKFASARAKRKIEKNEDYETPNLKVRQVGVLPDGSIFISCEEFWVEVHYYYSTSGAYSESRTYYYSDILATKIDASGKFEWLRKIPKRQRGAVPRGTMGYKLISDGSGFYFLYLDNLKNLHLEEDQVPKYHVDGYGGQVVVSKLDGQGNLSKELLFDTREEDIMIFPTDFYQINGNQFIGRAKLKKTLFQPLLITVN